MDYTFSWRESASHNFPLNMYCTLSTMLGTVHVAVASRNMSRSEFLKVKHINNVKSTVNNVNNHWWDWFTDILLICPWFRGWILIILYCSRSPFDHLLVGNKNQFHLSILQILEFLDFLLSLWMLPMSQLFFFPWANHFPLKGIICTTCHYGVYSHIELK